MKNLLGLVLLSVSLSACSNSCSRHDTVTTTVPTATAVPTVSEVTPAPVPPVKVKGSSWSMEIPASFERLPNDKEGLEAFFNDKLNKELISLTKEPYKGTGKDYALMIAADLTRADMEPDSSTFIKVGDTDFIQLECAKDGVHAWISSTVKGGQAYVFSCGGADDNQKLKATCSAALSSLLIK